MKTFCLTLTAMLFLLPLNACSASAKNHDNTPVRDFDLALFLGKWYEIARYDHRFERGMDATTAEYTVRPDGKVTVTNRGILDGLEKTAEGKAYQPDPQQNPARLRVSFFWFFYADYNVLLIDPAYSYALIGSKSDKYLWILSRTPVLPDGAREEILAEAVRRGYPTDKLIWVNHPESATQE